MIGLSGKINNCKAKQYPKQTEMNELVARPAEPLSPTIGSKLCWSVGMAGVTLELVLVGTFEVGSGCLSWMQLTEGGLWSLLTPEPSSCPWDGDPGVGPKSSVEARLTTRAMAGTCCSLKEI